MSKHPNSLAASPSTTHTAFAQQLFRPIIVACAITIALVVLKLLGITLLSAASLSVCVCTAVAALAITSKTENLNSTTPQAQQIERELRQTVQTHLNTLEPDARQVLGIWGIAATKDKATHCPMLAVALNMDLKAPQCCVTVILNHDQSLIQSHSIRKDKLSSIYGDSPIQKCLAWLERWKTCHNSMTSDQFIVLHTNLQAAQAQFNAKKQAQQQ